MSKFFFCFFKSSLIEKKKSNPCFELVEKVKLEAPNHNLSNNFIPKFQSKPKWGVSRTICSEEDGGKEEETSGEKEEKLAAAIETDSKSKAVSKGANVIDSDASQSGSGPTASEKMTDNHFNPEVSETDNKEMILTKRNLKQMWKQEKVVMS